MARKFRNFINNTTFKEENTLSYPPSHEFRILKPGGEYCINKKHIIKLQQTEDGEGIPVILWDIKEKSSVEVIKAGEDRNHFVYTYIRHHFRDLKIRSIFFIRSDSKFQMNVLSIGVMLEPFYQRTHDTHYMFGFVYKVTSEDFMDENVHSMGILEPDINLIKKFKYWQLPLLKFEK